MADSKIEEESKMSQDLYNTCYNGPLGELKEKINSSNINIRRAYSVW